MKIRTGKNGYLVGSKYMTGREFAEKVGAAPAKGQRMLEVLADTGDFIDAKKAYRALERYIEQRDKLQKRVQKAVKEKVRNGDKAARTKSAARTFFIWRNGDEDMKLMSLTPGRTHDQLVDLHDDALFVPMRWQVLATAYFRAEDGSEYREHCQITTPHEIIGTGGDSHMIDLLRESLARAEASGNANHLYHRTMIIRPYSDQVPDMLRPMRMVAKQAGFTDEEITQVVAAQDKKTRIDVKGLPDADNTAD